MNGLLLPELPIRPSLYLRISVVSLHGLAATALWYADLPLSYAGSLHGIVLGSLLWQWYRYGTAHSPGFVVELRIRHDDYWQWVYADGTVRNRTLKRYYIHAYLLVLQFNTEVPGLRSTLVITADATDSERLRQLRCHLLRLAWRAQA